MDCQKFEKALQVNLVRKNNDNTQNILSPLKFNVRYGEKDLVAWVNSDNVALAQSDNQYIEVKIDKNLTALLGNNSLEQTSFRLSKCRRNTAWISQLGF